MMIQLDAQTWINPVQVARVLSGVGSSEFLVYMTDGKSYPIGLETFVRLVGVENIPPFYRDRVRE